MSTKEIKELGQAGRLEEALIMAKWEAERDNFWCKWNINWMSLEYLKAAIGSGGATDAAIWLGTIREFDMPKIEEVLDMANQALVVEPENIWNKRASKNDPY